MRISEDWASVLMGAALIALALVGVFGKAAGLVRIPW